MNYLVDTNILLRLPDRNHPQLCIIMKHSKNYQLNRIKLFFRFQAMAAKGNPERGIAILDKLDTYFSNREK